MKDTIKILMVLLAATVFLCGCGKSKKTDTLTFLNVQPAALSFEADMEALDLTVNASDNLEWTVSTEADWLSFSQNSGKGKSTVSVSATTNGTGSERFATIQVSTTDCDPVTIDVTQKGDIIVDPSRDPLQLKFAECYYAGDFWGTDGKLDDVYFILSDIERQNGEIANGSTTIYLDINVPAATYETFSIEGNYTPSSADTPTQSGTFNIDKDESYSPTYVVFTDENGNRTRKGASGGAVTIRKDGDGYYFEIDLIFADGTSVFAAYAGKIQKNDDSASYNSTLKENVTPAFTSVSGTFYSWGQDAVEADALLLSFTGAQTDNVTEHMSLTLDVNSSAWEKGAIEGTYRIIEKEISAIAASDLVAGTAIPGYLSSSDGSVGLYGSWYYAMAQTTTQEQLSAMAPFTKGSIAIAREGETFTISWSFTDDNPLSPHTISGKYEGPITFTNLKGGTDPDPDPDPDPENPLDNLKPGATLGQFEDGGRW